ncbi:MAG: MFS transporter [Armatimonadetes bacterium]|nr:MFS transporter [Armatimonadota bacterium]
MTATSEESPKTHLHATVKAAGWVSFLTDFSSEIIYPLLPIFLTSSLVGASVAFVGVVEGVAESTASLLKLVSGWLSDRMGRRRPLVVFGYTISSIARPLVAAATAPWHVLLLRTADRVGKGLRSAPRDALIADVTPPEIRGRAYGFQRAMDHAGAVAGPLVAFGLLQGLGWSLRLTFAMAAIPAAAAVLVVALWVRDAPGTEKGPRKRLPLSWRDWSRLDRRLLSVLGIVGLFTLGNSSDAFLILRARDLGVSTALIPILWVALHVVKSLTSTPAGSLSDRIGRRTLILGGWFIYAFVYAGFALAGAAWHAWALFLVYGTFFGLTEGAEKALVSDLARPEERGAAFGLYAFLIGIMALPSSALMGVIWQKVGVGAAFFWGGGVALLAAILLALVPLTGRSGGDSR